MRNLEHDIKISIIIPVYKVPEVYLRNCLESIMQQKFEDYEVIIVDDGSPDNCGAICDEYEEKSEKIQVIHKENEGVSVARNCGLDIAQGTYIMFVDGDDMILENTLEHIYQILQRNSADISIFKFTRTKSFYHNDESQKISLLSKEQVSNMKKGILTKTEIFEDMCIGSPWAKVFRADFLQKNGIRYIPGIVKAQDRVFMTNCLRHTYDVQCVDYTYYYYNTENEMSVCKKYNENIFESLLKTGNEIENMINTKEYAQEINQMYEKFFVEIVTLNIFHKNNDKSFGENVALLKKVMEDEKFFQAIQVCDLKEYGKFFSIFRLIIRHGWYRFGILFGKIWFKVR